MLTFWQSCQIFFFCKTITASNQFVLLDTSQLKHLQKYLTMYLLHKLWHTNKHILSLECYTMFTPLWDNMDFPELTSLEGHFIWQPHGLFRLSQLYDKSILKSFSTHQVKFQNCFPVCIYNNSCSIKIPFHSSLPYCISISR